MPIVVGDRLPDATFKVMTADGPAERRTADIFGGKKVVLFAVPGAFTPTCHKNHLPGFFEHSKDIKAKGIDTIAVTAVNDVFVMNAWKKASGINDEIEFLADGGAQFVKEIGLEIDLSGGGLGTRSKRYSMLVDDGIVKILNIEDTPGKADVSGATNLLTML